MLNRLKKLYFSYCKLIVYTKVDFIVLVFTLWFVDFFEDPLKFAAVYTITVLSFYLPYLIYSPRK